MLARVVIVLAALVWAACLQAQDYTVYVIDTPNFGLPPWQILKYDRDGRNPEVFIDHHLNWPHDIVFLEEAGTVLVSNYTSGRVERFDAGTGQHIDTFASGIPGPTRMKIGPDGLLYVLSASANARVKRYRLDGTFVDDFTSYGLPRCLGLAWDERGYLYVSSYDLQVVRVFDREGVDLGIFVNTNLNGPANIWFDDSGDLLVLDYDAGVVARFNPDGRYAGDFIQGLAQSEGVDVLPDGTLLIGNGGTSAVKSFTPEGAFIADFVTSGLGGLSQPAAVVVRLDEVNINPGMADAWFDPSTAGQGFLITVFPDREELFVAWFTYDTERPPGDVTAYLGEPGHRWLTAQGPFEGDSAELTIHLTQGGVFDSAQPPAAIDPDGYGTMKVDFLTCREGRVIYDIPSLGLAGEIPIRRIVEDNVALCEALR